MLVHALDKCTPPFMPPPRICRGQTEEAKMEEGCEERDGRSVSHYSVLIGFVALEIRTRERVNMSSKPSASEFKISETWDHCIEKFFVNSSAGTLLAGAASVVLFRSPAARGFLTGIGTGFGAGLAWNECNKAFKASGLNKLPTLPISQNDQDQKSQ